MNILLTTKCSLECSYCFASSLRVNLSQREMTISEIETILTSLDPSNGPIRLMGGEPTLHSQYPEVLKMIKERDFQVSVFTNGLQSVLRKTAPVLPDRILLNFNDWSTYTPRQRHAIRTNLSALEKRISLATTILHPTFDLSVHKKLILEDHLHPMIRLGLAQPVVGGDNAYLPDADLSGAHRSLVKWAKALSSDGIRLSMDCGFMRCLFDDADIDELIRAGTVLNFDCSPTLDVGPGLKVWRCFAFSSSPGIDWSEFETLEHMKAWFNAQDREKRGACGECEHYRNAWCHGGCLARKVIGEDLKKTPHKKKLRYEKLV